MRFSMFSSKSVAITTTFGLAAAVVFTGAGAADAIQSAGWTTPVTNCSGHWTGTGADGKICVFNDANFVSTDGSGNIVDSSGAQEILNNFSGYVYNNSVSLDNSMSSYISGIDMNVYWYANAGEAGALLVEQPLGYRENLAQDGFNDVASSIMIFDYAE